MTTYLGPRCWCGGAFSLRRLFVIAAAGACLTAGLPNALGQIIQNATIDPDRAVYVGDPLFLSVTADVNEPQDVEYFGQFFLDAVYGPDNTLQLETSSRSPISNDKFSAGLNSLIQVPETTCLPVCQLGGSLIPDVPDALEATLIIYDKGGGEVARTVAGRLDVHSPGQVSVTPDKLTFSTDQKLTLTVEGMRLTDTVEDGISVRFVHESGYDTALGTQFAGPLDGECFAPLVCTVTVTNDTTLEIDVNLDLFPQARDRHVGTYHVVVTKAERDEEGGFFRTLRAPGIGVVTVGGEPDFAIDHIEVVQVVQNAANTLPLVSGKTFVIRVFPKLASPGKETSGIPVAVAMKIGEDTFEFERDGRDTIVTNTPDRGNKQHSYNIFISGSPGFPDGSVSFAAIINPDCSVTETDCDNNASEVTTVEFEQRPAFRVRYLPVCIQLPGQPESCPLGGLGNMGELTKRMFPVADHQFDYSSHMKGKLIWHELPNTEAKWQRLLQELEQLFYEEVGVNGEPQFDQLVGFLPEKTMGQRTMGDRALGVAAAKWLGSQGRVSLVVDQSNLAFEGPFGTSMTVAHELGHNAGLRHPKRDSCFVFQRADRDADPDSLWPFPDSNIQEHGADPIANEIKIGEPSTHPNVSYDLMSRCGTFDRWMSELHYIWILVSEFEPMVEQPSAGGLLLTSELTLMAGQPHLPDRNKEAVSGDFAFVTGQLSSDGLRGELDAVERFTGTAEPNNPDPDKEYCLQFNDDAGAALDDHCFSLNFRGSESPERLDEQSFSRLVSLPHGTAEISLNSQGVELDSIHASASAPQVEILSPAGGQRWEGAPQQFIRWTGSDPDGDPLRYSVFVSPTGNETWHALEVDLDTTEYSVDPSVIQGGPNVWLRVSVSDGFHHGEATVGPIDVVQQPQIAVDDAPVDVGEEVVGKSLVHPVTVSNRGTGPLTLTAVSSGSGLFEVLTTAFPMLVDAGDDRDLLVRYAPLTEGPDVATLTISSNATGVPELAVAIQGTGTDGQSPRLRLDQDAVGFFAVPTTLMESQVLGLENASLVDLEVEWELTGSDAFSAQEKAAAFTLKGGTKGFIEVSFAPQAAGEFAATLTIRSNDPDRPEVVVPVSGNAYEAPPALGPPMFTTASIVSAASFTGNRFSVDMWVTLFGENLATELRVAAGGLPISLGGTSVSATDSKGVRRAAKLQLVTPNQINLLIPGGTAIGEAVVEVTNTDGEAASATIQIESVAPGLFSANSSGQGPAAATYLRIADDATRTEGLTFTTEAAKSQNVPIDLNPGVDEVFLSFFGTGFRFHSTVAATIDGIAVAVLGAVAQGQFEGLDQAVVGPLPAALAGRGEVEVAFSFDGIATNPVTVDIR